MKLNIEIDSDSGFCNGVVRAVKRAESYLDSHYGLYSLGAIVHNSQEIERLQKKGLQIIDAEQMADLQNEVVLVRAHGEPPATYALAQKNELRLIDCTCPVVLRLQKQIASVYKEISQQGGTVVIFGKKGHAEVNGLVGQIGGNAVVVESADELDGIDFSHPVALFSQTTKDPEEYAMLIAECKARSKRAKGEADGDGETGKDGGAGESGKADVDGDSGRFRAYDTICKQVAARHKSLVKFAATHDVILFVSGHESSNGKVLFNLCKSQNPKTYWVENLEMLNLSVFKDGESVGSCGATSTPHWQLEELYIYLQDKIKN